MRPTLLPGLRRLMRDDRTVQIGTDPEHAVVLELRRPDLLRVLDLLDGSHTIHKLLAATEAAGIDASDTLELLQALRSAGLVVGAHALLPAGLPAPVSARLTTEAAAIGLRQRSATAPHLPATSPRLLGTEPRLLGTEPRLLDTEARLGTEPRLPSPESRIPGSSSLPLGPPLRDSEPRSAASDPVHPNSGQGTPGSGQGVPGPGQGVPGPGQRADGDAEHTFGGPGRGRAGGLPGGRARTPADVLRRRGAARVVVAGGGPLVAPLATALAAAGIGHVEPVVEGIATYADVAVGGLACDDVDASRAIATSTAIVRFAPGVNVSPVRSDTVDFVVRVGDRNPPALARRGFRLNALPRLEVTIRLGTVLVGPLVRPAASPCGQCLDRHRADRDPAWPALSAQLSTAKTDAGEPCAITTAMAGAAFAADEVLAYIDGLPLRTEAAIVEISRPGELRRREWTAHPRCDCRRRRRTTPSGTG